MSLHARRALLRFLAGSPLLAAAGNFSAALADGPSKLATAADALAVYVTDAAAHKVVPPAHWRYSESGVDGDVTLRANQAGYAHYQLKPRAFVDVSKTVLSATGFGTTYG